MSARGRVIRSAQRRGGLLRYDRGIVEHIVDATIGASAVAVHVNRIRMGSAPGPYHVHPSGENVYLVISGELRVRIDDQDHRLLPGDAAFIPAGTPHSASNLGSTDAEILEIYAPADPGFVEVDG